MGSVCVSLCCQGWSAARTRTWRRHAPHTSPVAHTAYTHRPHPRRARRVRHEAGEALGAIGRPECLEALRRHRDDAVPEVAETCQLALERIEYLQVRPKSSDCSHPNAYMKGLRHCQLGQLWAFEPGARRPAPAD